MSVEAVGAKAKKAAGWGVFWRGVSKEFTGLPVYVGVEDGHVYVKMTAPVDKRQSRRYIETCKRLGFRFDRRGERWVKLLEEPQPSPAV